MFKSVCVSVLFLGAVSVALAQVGDDFSAAHQASLTLARSGDIEGAFVAGEQAFAIASNQEERFYALYLLAQLANDLERYEEAANLAGRAATILREHFPSSTDMLENALSLQASATLHSGDRAGWLELNDEIMQLNAADVEAQWIVTDNGLQHRLTGYLCPQTVDFGVLFEPLSFELDGQDVGCKYMVFERADIVVSMHVYRTPGTSQDEAYRNAFTPLPSVFPNSRIAEEGETELAGLSVQYAILAAPDRDTGVWTTQIDDWTVKLRMTHFGNADRDDFEAAALQTFQNALAMTAHLADCDALSGATAMIEETETGSVALEAAIMLPMETFHPREYGNRLSCYIDDAPLGDESIAFAELDSAGRAIAFTARSTDGTGYSVHAVSNAALMPSIDAATENPKFVAFIMDDSGYHVLGMYETAPDPTTFLELARSVDNGTANVVSRVEVDENGDSNIVINFPDTEDE